ncbi:hypothetical protein J1614_012270 [Plenodomus biglobosus]|nr:hypothetical protein J1614_012270 [Plenodomus biglobosus]
MAHFSAYVTKADIDDEIPRTYAEAMKDHHLWQAPIDRDIQNHLDKGTREIVQDVPPGTKLVGTQWALDIKRNEDAQIIKRKARIVAQGFSQRRGIDFEVRYPPVVRYDSLRIIIAVAVLRRWPMRQVDFDAAHLNGRLTDTIYARAPPGVDIMARSFKYSARSTETNNQDASGSHCCPPG